MCAVEKVVCGMWYVGADNKWRNGYQKIYPIHYTNPFARDFLEIRQLYFISMNYSRWICAIRVA